MSRLEEGPLPIDELEPVAGEAVAAGFALEIVPLLSIAASLRRIADQLERERPDEHAIIRAFMARQRELFEEPGAHRHVAPSIMAAALDASRQIDPDLTVLPGPFGALNVRQGIDPHD